MCAAHIVQLEYYAIGNRVPITRIIPTSIEHCVRYRLMSYLIHKFDPVDTTTLIQWCPLTRATLPSPHLLLHTFDALYGV